MMGGLIARHCCGKLSGGSYCEGGQAFAQPPQLEDTSARYQTVVVSKASSFRSLHRVLLFQEADWKLRLRRPHAYPGSPTHQLL
jgi:hypothetical protein